MYSNTYRKNGPKSTLRIECALAFWPDVPSGIRQCALCICRGSTAVRALSSRGARPWAWDRAQCLHGLSPPRGQGTVPSGPSAAPTSGLRVLDDCTQGVYNTLTCWEGVVVIDHRHVDQASAVWRCDAVVCAQLV